MTHRPSSRARRNRTVIAVAMVVGCHSTDDAQSIGMTGWVSSPAEDDLVRAVVRDFEQRFPDLSVRYDPIQANYIDKIQLMLGTGTAPDVFMLDAFWAPALVAYDTLLPLDEFIASDPDFDIDDFEPALLDAFRRDGKLYGLPKDYSTLALFYNPEMLARAEIKSPPTNWDELFATAQRLTQDTDGDGRIDQYGFGLVDGLEYVLPFIWQNAAEFLSSDGTVNIDDAGVRDALRFLQRLRRSGIAKLPSEVGAAWNMDGFGRQRIAMTFSGLWAVNFMRTTFPNTPYAIANLPRGKTKQSIAYVVGYVIPKDAASPRRAWTLLRYLTSKQGQAQWAKHNIGLSPRRSIAATEKQDQHPLTSVFTRSARHARTWQLGTQLRVLDETQTALQSIYIEDVDVDDAMENLRRRLQQRVLRRRP